MYGIISNVALIFAKKKEKRNVLSNDREKYAIRHFDGFSCFSETGEMLLRLFLLSLISLHRVERIE